MNAWAWALELILIALLVATLFYAMRLERSIGVLRKDRAGLSDVLSTIRTALDDADRGLQSLQHMADVTGRALTGQIGVATQAQHDMQYLLDRLESVAAKVETVIKAGRIIATAEDGSQGAPAPAAKPGYSKAERDLLKVLRLSK
jgi:hypothetical protein